MQAHPISAGWIGLADPLASRFNRSGLGRTAPVAGGPLLERGTLRVELAQAGALMGAEVVALAAKRPWPFALTLRIGAEGAVSIGLGTAQAHAAAQVAGVIGAETGRVTVTYLWDAPARCGWLCVEDHGRGVVRTAAVANPPPVTAAWAEKAAYQAPVAGAAYLAIADRPSAIGPRPTLAPHTMIETPTGERPVNALSSGDLIVTVSGRVSEIRATGWADLPARGICRAMGVPARPFGRDGHALLAAGQRIAVPPILAGGRTGVVVPAETLVGSGVAEPAAQRPLIRRYHHLLLDRVETFRAGGIPVESIDARALDADPVARRLSILGASRSVPRKGGQQAA
ncbi:Hint domain-containing protein [Aestuariibius sp. 2305UL40-4]|uniref:Hint domain-containing protein n=1 Tax=Aestuariibius violaceus TaxID=3234132 RepID=UPI00345F0C43